MKGLVAFSFGLRDIEHEPNPCNVRLAQAVMEIIAGEQGEVVVVSQWEYPDNFELTGTIHSTRSNFGQTGPTSIARWSGALPEKCSDSSASVKLSPWLSRVSR